jgi:antitoxin component YwqK of YwqJK toxin-antitoxin module
MIHQLYSFVLLFIVGFFLERAKEPVALQLTIPDVKVLVGDQQLGRTREGLVLYKDSVFSGMVVDRYSNGQLKSKKSFFEGKQEDLYLGFYPSGDSAFVRPYLNGKKHGIHKGWYANGQLKFKYNFVNGLSEGNHLDWYASGDMFKESNYENGQAFGTQKAWRMDGKLRSNYVIREDGRKYGLLGLKRCANIDTDKQQFNRLTSSLK